MAYCTEAQVLAEFKSLSVSGSTTSVTSANIAIWIAEADAEINAKIGTRYVTPVTGATSLILLRTISIWIVSARIKSILQVKTLSETTNQLVIEIDPRKRADDLIDQIVKGTVLLSDATLASSADGVRSYIVDEDLEEVFDVTEDNW